MRAHEYYVYIVTNKSWTLYTGVTNNLERRVWEYKHGATKGFTSKYRTGKLIYMEQFRDIRDAITREKQIKVGRGPRNGRLSRP